MDVRISPAEAIDAHETVDTVGYGDREFLKDALCVALAKSEEEVGSFEECFDMFFTREEFQDRRDNDSANDDKPDDSNVSESDRDLIGDQELAQLVPPLSVDNFEGLAVHPDPAGGWLIYLLSDDNFNPLQRTLLLQFHLAG